MTWENLETNLQKALNVKIAFPSGDVWLPEEHLTLDEWLTSAAQSDEELKALNMSRIEFLRNRWRVEELIHLHWNDPFDDRSIFALYVGDRSYILFSDGVDYQVIAAIAPVDRPELFRAVIGKLMKHSSFVPPGLASIRNYRPDLIFVETEPGTDEAEVAEYAESARASIVAVPRKEKFSTMFMKWVRQWIDFPALGFWRQDIPESVRSADDGEYELDFRTPAEQRSKKPHKPGRRAA